MKKFLKVLSLALPIVLAMLGVAEASAMTATAVITDGSAGVGKHVTGEALDTVVTEEASPELLQAEIDKVVVKIKPSEHVMDIVARLNGRKVPVESMKYDYYSVDDLPNDSTITVAVASETAQSTTITVADASRFQIKSTIKVPSVFGYNMEGTVLSTSRPLMLYVTSRTGSTLTVQAVNGAVHASGGRICPDIAADAEIYRMATADYEGNMRNEDYSALPTPDSNFCQIFAAEIAMSTIQAMTNKEVKWDFSDLDEMATEKMLREMEASYRWGSKSKFINLENNKTVYTTEGIVNQMDQFFTLPAAPTNNDLIDLAKKVFTGNNGSDKRIWLMGSDVNAALSKIPSVQKQIDSKETTLVWGIEFSEIRTNFGTLMCYYDQTMDENGKSDSSIIIDPNFLTKGVFREMASKAIETKLSGQFDGDVQRMEEISCLCLRNKPAHSIVTLGV